MIQFTDLLNEETEYKANYDPTAKVGRLETVIEVEDVKPFHALEDSMLFLSNKGTLTEIESLFPNECKEVKGDSHSIPIFKGTPVLNVDYQSNPTYIFWNETELFWIFEPTKEPNVKIKCANLTYYAVNHEIVAISCKNFTLGPEQ